MLHKHGSLAMLGFHRDPGREMGNWYYCCVIIKAPSDDNQAVIYYMEHSEQLCCPAWMFVSVGGARKKGCPCRGFDKSTLLSRCATVQV